jgi:hypothetical protein
MFIGAFTGQISSSIFPLHKLAFFRDHGEQKRNAKSHCEIARVNAPYECQIIVDNRWFCAQNIAAIDI